MRTGGRAALNDPLEIGGRSRKFRVASTRTLRLHATSLEMKMSRDDTIVMMDNYLPGLLHLDSAPARYRFQRRRSASAPHHRHAGLRAATWVAVPSIIDGLLPLRHEAHHSAPIASEARGFPVCSGEGYERRWGRTGATLQRPCPGFCRPSACAPSQFDVAGATDHEVTLPRQQHLDVRQ